MPQLEKATDSQLDVEIIGEVLHDYKIGLPPFKKESASNQLTEWPVLTLENDYSENNDKTSSRNTVSSNLIFYLFSGGKTHSFFGYFGSIKTFS